MDEGDDDSGEAGPLILLRARDVNERNFKALADFPEAVECTNWDWLGGTWLPATTGEKGSAIDGCHHVLYREKYPREQRRFDQCAEQ